MAIVTLDGILAGMRPPEFIYKSGTAPKAIGTLHSHFYAAGRPGAAVAPTPGVAGAALTTYAGQIPWTNPGAGNSYLARLQLAASVPCTLLVCDRLWHNSGLSITLTTSQTVNSVAWPARDKTGTTNGDDILVSLEFSATGGAGTPTVTLGYTNQAGTAGKTASFVGLATNTPGTFYHWALSPGDTGVRSVQTYQANATWTSGTIHLVAYRVLGIINLPVANVGYAIDAITSGFPRLYDNTVPFILQLPSATTSTNVTGQMMVTQG